METIFGKIVDLVDTVFDRLVPDKNKAAQIKAQFNKELMQAMLQERDMMQKFILDYEGRATEVPKFVLLMRSLIRPVFTWLFGLIGAAWVVGQALGVIQKNMPQALAVWVGIVMSFWFGGRFFEKIKGKP